MNKNSWHQRRKVFSLLTCGFVVIPLVSCDGGSNSTRTEGTLSVLAYNGGYGTEWLQEICDEFTKETGILTTCNTDSTILTKIESQLTSTSDYDIYMSHGLNWQNYAQRDLLADLDSLYSSTTTEMLGTDVTSGQDSFKDVKFVDRIAADGAELSQYTNSAGETHYYKVPFTQGAGGFVYNMDMFEQYNWSVPTTYDELVSLCAQIVTDTNGEVLPFAWAGARDYYWDYPIYEWWYELDGAENFNTWLSFKGPSGNYADGYENFNGEGRAKNFKKAYEMWYNLVGEHSEYCNKNAYSANLVTAQNTFFTGKAAMIPYAQWCKKEIENAQKSEFTFNVAMMPTPKVSASTEKNVNFMVGYGDSMIIPKNSPNIENAKKFLSFMSTSYACRTFVEKAEGPFLGFDYSQIDLSDIENSDTYVKSIHSILTDCTNFSTTSNNPIVVANGDTDLQPWVKNLRYYKDCALDPTKYDPDTVFDKVYETAKNNWNGWVRNAGVQ